MTLDRLESSHYVVRRQERKCHAHAYDFTSLRLLFQKGTKSHLGALLAQRLKREKMMQMRNEDRYGSVELDFISPRLYALKSRHEVAPRSSPRHATDRRVLLVAAVEQSPLRVK